MSRTTRSRRASVFVLAATLAACPPPPSPPPPTITVTATPTEVVADGASRVIVTVSHPSGLDVRLTASRGTWRDTNGPATTVPGGAGNATLVSCDSRVEIACAGAVRVNASSSDNGSGSATVNFKTLENCSNATDDDGDGVIDCADTDCGGITCRLPAGSVGTGACTGGACVCSTGTRERCDDRADNDCNGKVDCADPGCRGDGGTPCGPNNFHCLGDGGCGCLGKVENCLTPEDDDCNGSVNCDEPLGGVCRPGATGLGKPCDLSGHLCSQVINGASTCSVCFVPDGGFVEIAEGSAGGASLTCGDLKDNDCDGTPTLPATDCQDPDCNARPCTKTGKVCDLLTKDCVCTGPPTEVTCDDGRDDDCDGMTDCADNDCDSDPCDPRGGVCAFATKKCVCSGNGGTPEAAEGASTTGDPTCGDSKDNDCDTLVDCGDPNCRPPSTLAFGKDCSQPNANPRTVGKKCDFGGQCVCPDGQAREASCADLADNDCDGLVNCADPDCLNQACSATGKRCTTTSPTGCTCPTGLSSETTCKNLIDDDCDALIDCADPDCANAECNTASTNYRCLGTTKVCQDTSSSFSLTITAAMTRIPADGVASTAVTAVLKDNTVAQGGRTVAFAVTAGPGTLSAASAVTSAAGSASVTFTSGAAGGVSTVTASFDTGTQTITASVNINQPGLSQIKVASQQYQIMGVKYSGFQDANKLTFQLLDAANATYPKDLLVTFTHARVGGSDLGASSSCTATNCTATGATDAQGIVQVILRSGTVASVVSVTAAATAGGFSASATVSNIAIIGAKASGNSISLNCTPKNVPAFTNHDCTNSFLGATVTCTAAFADRFNNVLGDGVSQVATFTSEAGAAGPPATVKSGVATGQVFVNGYSLPRNVTPLPGEHALIYNSGCGALEHNPRDGLVSIIVSTTGEEGFVDGSNGQPANGVHDVGEYFINLGEPFVDTNDNGLRDGTPAEPYVDSNNNGQWDGPNTQWDENTVIWAEARIVYTGYTKIHRADAVRDDLSRWYLLSANPPPPKSGPTAPPTFSVTSSSPGPATSASFGVYFADENFNQPVKLTTYDLKVISGGVTAKFTTSPDPPLNTLGLGYTQQFCSAQTGGTCANTCQWAPCFVVGTVSGFSYGTYGVAEITGGATTGNAEVRAIATFNLVPVAMPILGTVN